MDPFLIILVVVFIIILITIIGVVIFLIINNPESSPPPTGCVNNDGCSAGFICQTGVCKAGIGTACNQDSDCETNLRCDTTSQVCVPTRISNQSKEPLIRPRKNDALLINYPSPGPPLVHSGPPPEVPIPEVPVSESPVRESPVRETSVPEWWPSQPEPTFPPEFSVTEPSVIELALIARPGSFQTSNTPLSSPTTPLLPVRNPTTRTVVRQFQGSTTPVSALESYATPSPPVRRRPPIESSPSSDDEINSGGEYSAQPFDIRSGISTPVSTDQDSVTQISTPCQQHDGIYYCRSLQAQIEEIEPDLGTGVHQSSPVIDVCTYSDVTLFLLEDGHIISEREVEDPATKVRLRITNSIKLAQIRGFSGYVYGVDFDGRLYFLPNTYFGTTNWRWSLAGWAPGQIKHLSTTHDGVHLWLQTDFGGAYLYDRPHHCILELEDYTYRRVYGRDLAHYLEIDTINHTAILHPEGKTLPNICDGALSYYDEVVAIHPADRAIYRGITIVNWRPYYIRY